jgi:putative phosphoribosyl transferase
MATMFADRREAGRLLAERLEGQRGKAGIVLALPRGGVPVGDEIARALGLPLDLVLVRKVGVPGHEELALAAIAGPAGEEIVVNEDVARIVRADRARIDKLAEPQRAELLRRRTLYLGDRPPPDLAGKVAILVDDGVATGATMRAAIRALRALGPARILVAVPVGAPDTLDRLRAEADEIVCLSEPDPFIAVGAHYARFPQTSDDEVCRILREAEARLARPNGPGAPRG